jgi:hypothetical protein
MLRSTKRQISKTISGSPELPITRTESAFALTCYRCGRDAEGREIEIELPPSLGQRNVVWTRVPDGWWVQGTTILKLTAGCPGCMETPLEVSVPRKPEARCKACGHPPGFFPCDLCDPVDNNIPGKHD